MAVNRRDLLLRRAWPRACDIKNELTAKGRQVWEQQSTVRCCGWLPRRVSNWQWRVDVSVPEYTLNCPTQITQLKHSVINQRLPGYRTLQDTGRRLSSNRWCLLKNNRKFYCKAATTICLIPPIKNHISATKKTQESNFLSLRTTPRGHASYAPSVCRQHGAHRMGVPCPVLLAQRQLQVKCLNTRTLLLPRDFILHWKG